MREAGFTLVEMLVALFIFSILAAGGAALITFSLDGQEISAEGHEKTAALSIARSLIRNDMTQMTRRAARPPLGGSGDIIMAGGLSARDGVLITFVQNGWANPQVEAARSTLQYVEYILEDERFIRRSRTHVDAPPQPDVRERILLEGVKSADIRFRSNGQWSNRWLASVSAQGVLPDAVAFDLDVSGYGRLSLLALVGEAST